MRERKPLETFSLLQRLRLEYKPALPKVLQNIMRLQVFPGVSKSQIGPITNDLKRDFPYLTAKESFLSIKNGKVVVHQRKRIGVVLSGGQAAGGHNVITGLFDALKTLNAASTLIGFLDGPKGIVEGKYIELTEELLSLYRNQGGFDLIGSGRTKIETEEQFIAAENTCRVLDLDGLVIVGGDDSNTNAAYLAEYFLKHNCRTAVIGVPKTIDGDLSNEDIEISFGFDTATKTYAEIIGNIMRDALSAKKYYYFIKLMGRSASHVTLECALQTHPNMSLIGEEIASLGTTLSEVVSAMCDLICNRSKDGKNYGVVLIPEGIIEFIPDFKEDKQIQMAAERDPHGNIQVSKIETERFFIEKVKLELERRKKAGTYAGKFEAQPLFCGYEGRSALPSNFDATYCYALGHAAALFVDGGVTGYICCARGLGDSVENWEIGARNLVTMMAIENRNGKDRPVVSKRLVDLGGKSFAEFRKQRKEWELGDDYRCPGPIQFFGPEALVDSVPRVID